MSDTTHSSQSNPENGPASAVGEASLAEDLARAVAQRDEYLAQLQRSQAEFSNYQKRSKAQAAADQAYAVGGLAFDLVSVLDNFERATEAARGTGASSIVEGLELVHRQLLSALAKHGIEPIVAVGLPFDPNQHEALTQQPSADHPAGTVIAELGKGYRLKDRIIRPTKVAISIRPEG